MTFGQLLCRKSRTKICVVLPNQPNRMIAHNVGQAVARWRTPARHSQGCRRLHHEAAEGRTARLEEWQTATEALLMAAEDRGPLMHARIGVLRALNRNIERTFTDRKDSHWGKRKL